jgi:hypothetical protein
MKEYHCIVFVASVTVCALSAGPAMIAAGQYPYAMQPWLYAPNIIQQGAAQQQAGQQQAQMMRGQGGRPLTPNQQGDSALGTPNPAGPQALQAQSECQNVYQQMWFIIAFPQICAALSVNTLRKSLWLYSLVC